MMLAGKVIINTRQEGSDDRIGDALKSLGATVLSMPLIEIQPITIPPKVLLEISQNNTYQWLIFTSKNGVDHFFNQFKGDFTVTLPFRTVVFGKRTALALQERGGSPDIVNLGNSAGDLLDDLMPKLQSGDKVLLALGNLAADILQERLASKIDVERLDVYRTTFVPSIDSGVLQVIAEDNYDLILFTSPSGYKSFKHHLGAHVDFSKLKIACIGPTTEEAINASGIKPLVVARPSGKVGLLKGIEHYFATHSLAETPK